MENICTIRKFLEVHNESVTPHMFFSDMYKEKGPNKASGDSAKLYTKKPVLCVYDSGINTDVIISKFKDLCLSNNIEVSPENVAIVKRGKIHTDNVKDIWKNC
ncbi:MAG: hypothetical protein L6V93_03120 [Clostridiales bacterium]|nr:MAG: hypothetical protein L6V93_03120 [Clostridiales bacterium]